MKKTITAHCIVKNEENFVWFAIKSVVDCVDKIIVFDTGSKDKTVDIIEKLVKEYPEKIVFEEKGVCNKKRHTELRNEMIEKTTTDWFMVLDGDEVWTKKGLKEALKTINNDERVECLIAQFYLCVGDIYHTSKRGKYVLSRRKEHASPRFFRNNRGIHWGGDYDNDAICDENDDRIFEKKEVIWTKERFWHLTHLERSNIESDYSSGGLRKDKKRLTYFLIGKKIKENVPEVFKLKENISYLKTLSFSKSVINFFKIAFVKFL